MMPQAKRALLVLTVVACAGCYRSHSRAVDGASDGAVVEVDAGRASRDAGRLLPGERPDAGADPEIEPPPRGARVVQLTAGADHVCARTDDGALYCWGDNSVGQVAAGRRARLASPSRVRGLPPIAWVDAIDDHTCAVDREGGLHCWGFSAYGQLGVPDSAIPDCGAAECSRVPLRVDHPAVELAWTGHHGTCVRDIGGAVRCWGRDAAVGATPADALHGALDVDFGLRHGCALTAAGVRCFGESEFGRWGDGDRDDGVVDLDGVVALEVGAEHACALDEQSRVFCWGYDWSGSLGRPKVELPYCVHGDTGGECAEDPVRPSGEPLARALSVGAHRTCILGLDGGVACWGAWTVAGATVYCGGVPGECDHVITPVEGLEDPIVVETGGSVACALEADGEVYCWGDNRFGQLGDGTHGDRGIAPPVRVLGFGE